MLFKDRYPFVVVEGGNHSLTVRPLTLIRDLGPTPVERPPARFYSFFPVWDHIYNSRELVDLVDPDGTSVVLHQRSDGRWYDDEGIWFAIGQARYYQDESD